ncbi:uncharacterized protein LOC125228771 [Leguminivora glycinivorella]|uniref:uncharacterized protein LOC125228771 n=1 Tax=Leguminivora glycinivorella TaxID=1035111 RepID=UPI00200CE771|nr:uncharacterized protein LOC125228771 [Leguminivora glycinivorella]
MRWFILLCAAAFLNNADAQNQIWELNSSLSDLFVGPDSAVHCQLTNPSGNIVFDDFGPCRVNIDRVTEQHSGLWTMSIIQQNNVLAVRQSFTAQVTSSAADSKPTVSTSVQQEKPVIKLLCSMANAELVTACVFRDPSGRVLQARQGVSEDRYSFIESLSAGVQSCGIEINGPLVSDLGLWRCDLQTTADTYFGHLTVLCPWAMQDPEIAAAVISVPTLTSQTKDQVVSEGDSVTMSCSIQTAIRYCYFRARNGTIFNVRPGMTSSSVEYVGAGLGAGECGIRFPSLFASDSGTWSCHVGFADSSEEQRVQFSIQVQEPISASQFVECNELVIAGVVNGHPALDYCRFVRIDGLGFTSENVPAGYTDSSSLSQGHCKIRMAMPTILEHHAWTVVAKVRSQDNELSQSTDHTIEMPPPDGPVTWWIYVMIVLTLVALVGAFAFKRNRRWASETATGIRDSFRKNKYPEQEKPPLPA